LLLPEKRGGTIRDQQGGGGSMMRRTNPRRGFSPGHVVFAWLGFYLGVGLAYICGRSQDLKEKAAPKIVFGPLRYDSIGRASKFVSREMDTSFTSIIPVLCYR
jgi:hypothetical protein